MATVNKNLSSYDKKSLPDASSFRFGLVVSEWNDDITESLFEGAKQVLLDNNVKETNIERIDVPGSFELVYGCKKMIQNAKKFDAIIAIGSVIQGETKHFDFICNSVSLGIKDLNIQYDTPVIFCVLTDNTKQQAIDRSGGKHGNKGAEGAVTAIKMAALHHSI